jgi:hypothetical protein
MAQQCTFARMKLWRFLLAMYVLVLSGLPCEAFCRDETSTATTQTSLPTGEREPDESCSPVCLCATCAGFTVPQPPQLMAICVPDVLIVVALLSSYQLPHAFDIPERIWQPPRFR